jgi:hypothetical protein
VIIGEDDIEAIVYISMFLLFLIASIAVFVIALLRKGDKSDPQLVITPPVQTDDCRGSCLPPSLRWVRLLRGGGEMPCHKLLFLSIWSN